MIFPDSFAIDDLYIVLKDDKVKQQAKWLYEATYPHFKPLYFFDEPIFSGKKMLKSWEFRHIEEGGFFSSFRLLRENFSEKILVAPGVLPWLSPKLQDKIYSYQFRLNEKGKNGKKENLVVFDYFNGVTKLEAIQEFLKNTINPSREYLLYPVVGGKFYADSFIEVASALNPYSNVKLITYDLMIKKILKKEVNIFYKKDTLLVGTSYLEKLMALYGEVYDYGYSGEVVKTLPFGNDTYVEIFKPFFQEIKTKIDYDDPLVKELTAKDRLFDLNDPWLKYLSVR